MLTTLKREFFLQMRGGAVSVAIVFSPEYPPPRVRSETDDVVGAVGSTRYFRQRRIRHTARHLTG